MALTNFLNTPLPAVINVDVAEEGETCELNAGRCEDCHMGEKFTDEDNDYPVCYGCLMHARRELWADARVED